MTRIFLFVFYIALLSACKPGVPKDVVQPEEMEKILFDIHLIDGYVSGIPTPDSARKVSAPIYKGIFKKYGIDSATHAKSMVYYYQHPDILSKMYDKIGAKMGKTRDEEAKRHEKEQKLKIARAAKLKKAAEKKTADSLKKVNEKKKVDTAKKAVKPFKKLVEAPKAAVKK